jgi:hypothetical protein
VRRLRLQHSSRLRHLFVRRENALERVVSEGPDLWYRLLFSYSGFVCGSHCLVIVRIRRDSQSLGRVFLCVNVGSLTSLSNSVGSSSVILCWCGFAFLGDTDATLGTSTFRGSNSGNTTSGIVQQSMRV